MAVRNICKAVGDSQIYFIAKDKILKNLTGKYYVKNSPGCGGK